MDCSVLLCGCESLDPNGILTQELPPPRSTVHVYLGGRQSLHAKKPHLDEVGEPLYGATMSSEAIEATIR